MVFGRRGFGSTGICIVHEIGEGGGGFEMFWFSWLVGGIANLPFWFSRENSCALLLYIIHDEFWCAAVSSTIITKDRMHAVAIVIAMLEVE